MRVIGASWGRTGTTSAAAALELLAAVWDEHFGGWEGFLDREHAIAAYDAHVEDVRRTCPEGRLIEWRVSDGWEPICTALDIPVPGVAVPHLNARDSA